MKNIIKKYQKQLFFLISLMLLFLLNSCSSAIDSKNISSENKTKTLKPKIEVITVFKQNKTISIETTGIVKPSKIIIKALAPGKVTNILAKIGEKLINNQPLAYLFNEGVENNYATALNFYISAEKFYNQALETNKKLDIAYTNFEFARKNLDSVALNKFKQTILTPFKGDLSRKMIALGERIDIGQELFEITLSNPVKIETSLAIENIKLLSVGDKVIINNKFESQLNKINIPDEPNDKKFNIEIEYDNSNFDLKIENSVNLEIPLQNLKLNNIYLIPQTALNLPANPNIIKIIEDNKIVEREVEYLHIINNQVLINKGLESGEQVVIENNESLKVGTEVEISDY